LNFLKEVYGKEFVDLINFLTHKYKNDIDLSNNKQESLNTLNSYYLLYDRVSKDYNEPYARSIIEQIYSRTLVVSGFSGFTTGRSISASYDVYNIAKDGFNRKASPKSNNLSYFLGQLMSFMYTLNECGTDDIIFNDLVFIFGMYLQRLYVARVENNVLLIQDHNILNYVKVLLRQFIAFCNNHVHFPPNKQVIINLYDTYLMEEMLAKYTLALSHRGYVPNIKYVKQVQDMLLHLIGGMTWDKKPDPVRVHAYFSVKDKRRHNIVKALSDYTNINYIELLENSYSTGFNKDEDFTTFKNYILTKKDMFKKNITTENVIDKLVEVIQTYSGEEYDGTLIQDTEFKELIDKAYLRKVDIIEIDNTKSFKSTIHNILSSVEVDCEKVADDLLSGGEKITWEEYLEMLCSTVTDAHTINTIKKQLVDDYNSKSEATLYSSGYVDYSRLKFTTTLIGLEESFSKIKVPDKIRFKKVLERRLDLIDKNFNDIYLGVYEHEIKV